MLEPTIEPLLQSAVGVTVKTRVYPVKPPEGFALPMVVYSCDMMKSIWRTTGPTGAYTYKVTVETHAIDFLTVMDIAGAIRTALDGYKAQDIIDHCECTGAGAIEVENGYGYQLEFEVLAYV